VGIIAEVGDGATGVDTSVFIYLIEEDPRFLSTVLPLFREADDGRRQLVTSALTLLEVLVVPYRAANRRLAERYEALLTRSRGIRMIDLTRDQLRAAAELRAIAGVRTPDALQMVAAIGAGCTSFVTNDRRIPSVPGLRIVQLDRRGA